MHSLAEGGAELRRQPASGGEMRERSSIKGRKEPRPCSSDRASTFSISTSCYLGALWPCRRGCLPFATAARLESVASGVLVVGISIAALIAFADWRPIFAAPQACSAGFGPARRPGFGAKIPVGKGQAWQSWLAFARPAKFRLKAEWRGRGKRRKCDRPSRFWIGPLVRHPRP